MGVYGVHPYVLTNFIGDRRDTSTIAHEMRFYLQVIK